MGILCEKSTLSISHNAVHILIIILQHSGGMNEPSTKFLLLDQFVVLAEAPPKHKTVLDNFPETLHKSIDITQSNATKYFSLIIFGRCLRYIISWHIAATLFWSSTDSFALYVCGSSMISLVSLVGADRSWGGGVVRIRMRSLPHACHDGFESVVSSSPSSVVVVSHEGAIFMSGERMFVSSLEKDILLE